MAEDVMIGNAKICLLAALPLALTILAGCTSQTLIGEAAAPQSICEGEAGCLITHGPIIRADIIDRKTIILWDLEENIYRVGTRDTCLATSDIKEISFLSIARPRTYGVVRKRVICANKLDRMKATYFALQVRPATMNCLITSVSVISDAEYEALIVAATGEKERPRPTRRMNWDRGAR